MRENFPLFFAYHFGWEFKKFHVDWMRSLNSDRNVFIEGFRASRKTTIIKGYVLWSIVYEKFKYIVRQSYQDADSASAVTDIAKMLFSPNIIQDYGQLFPLQSKVEDFSKKTQGNFDTTNKIKVQSRALMQSTRGLNTFNTAVGHTERPDLLILDDIDVVKSVTNPVIINQNERKLLGEVFGALNPERRKIIFLGNTILEDGIVPRLRRMYENNDRRDVYRQPLIDDKGENLRPEVFTESVIEDAKGDGKIAFQQNYLLIPATAGSGVFVREYFQYFIESLFENVDSPIKKTDFRRGLFIDPAFSTNASSDDAVVMIIGEHKVSKQYYLLDGCGGTSAPSSTRAKAISMHNKALLGGYRLEFRHCEDAPINKDQTQFIQDLRSDMLVSQINCPLYTSVPNKQKEQRIKDSLEPLFSTFGIKFNRNLDTNFLSKLERQLLDFPNSDHDDHPDCLAQGVSYFRKSPDTENMKPVTLNRY